MSLEELKTEVGHLLALQEETVVRSLVDGHGRPRLFVHQNLKDVTVAPNRSHTFRSIDSLLEFAVADGEYGKSAVFVGEKAVVLLLDRHTMEGRSVYPIERSRALGRWLKTFDQGGLIDHLRAWGAIDGVGAGLDSTLLALAGLKLAQTIKYDSAHADGRTISLQYSIEGGDTRSGKMPREWALEFPVHEGGPSMQVELILDLQMPKNDAEKPKFAFSCPKLDAYLDESVAAIREQIVNDLGDGWLVLEATPGT